MEASNLLVWGFFLFVNTIKVMAKYSFIDKFYNNRALVKVKEKWGYIDENNIEVITPQYDDAYPFETDEFTFVKKGDFWGGIDINGNIVLPFEYKDVELFYNDCFYSNVFRLKHNGKFGYIDAYGDVFIPFQYDYIEAYDIGFEVLVCLNGRYGVYNVNDGEVIPPIYATPESAWDAFRNIDHPEECEYNIKGERRVYDSVTGGYVWIPHIYEFDFLQSCTHGFFNSDGLLAVCINNKYGIINKQLEEVVPIRYDSIGFFRDGVADVRIHNRTGYINKKGEMRVKDGDQEAWIPTKYEWGDDFQDGYAAVMLNHKWGFINRGGAEVIPLIYDEVLVPGFCNGKATVLLDGKWMDIDIRGDIIS